MEGRAIAPPVCVIVTVWNQAEWTLACLSDVMAQDYADHSVVVVDNGSTDDAPERARRRYPELEIVSTGRNLGTSGGYNVGIR